MIQYLRHNEIDKEKWDKCIASAPNGIVYASSWYLDIVSPDWDALVEDNYVRVFPLTRRRKFGFNYLYQPYFTQQLGIFGADKEVKESKVREFTQQIPKKFKLIEIQLNESNKANSLDGFLFFLRVTHLLPLSESYEKLFKNFSENRSRNIKKAGMHHKTVRTDISYSEIINLFRQNRGKDIGNLKDKEYNVLDKLLAAIKERELLDIRGIVDKEGILLAGIMMLRSFHSYIFLFSATSEIAKETGCMSLLIDSFIRDHSNENMFLDFEGSMDTNLARFYKSFGSEEVVYLQIRRNNLPLLIRWLK